MTARVAIVGNSFVGAVLKAFTQDPEIAGDLRIDFAATGDGSFANVGVEDGRIVNVRATEHFRTGPIADYDVVFVYGSFPSPHAIARHYRKMVKRRYSGQVIASAIRDTLETSPAHVVYRRIVAATEAPVFILSANVRSNMGELGLADYDRSVASIRELVGDAYLEVPARLLTPDRAPRHEFYKGSVNVYGDEVVDNGDKHDISHFNKRGGAVILADIVDRVDALLAHEGVLPLAAR